MDKSDVIKLISANAHAQRFREGQFIVREGEAASEGLCFVLTGSVRIVQQQGEIQVTLGQVGTGQFFGETALLLDRTRSASAIADSSSVIIMFLNRERFLAEAHNNYHLLRILVAESIERIERVIHELIRLPGSPRIQIDPTLLPIIAENRQSNLAIPRLLNHTRSIFIGSGQSVFRQGQRNDGLIYLVTEGTVDVQRDSEDSTVDLFQFSAGDFFGYSRPASSPFREYTALARDGQANIINFDEDLLYRLMHLDIGIFYNLFRSILTHLLILDDSLRLAVAREGTTE